MDCMSGSTKFQDVNSICSQPAVVLSLCGMLSHDHSLRPDTWNLVGTPGNVFGNPCAVIDSSSTPYQGMLHSGTQYDQVQGNLLQKVKIFFIPVNRSQDFCGR